MKTLVDTAAEEWSLDKECVAFETDQHELCNGRRIRMHKSLFTLRGTKLIGNLYVVLRPMKAKPSEPLYLFICSSTTKLLPP